MQNKNVRVAAEKPLTIVSYDTSRDAGWVTLRINYPLEEKDKRALVNHLQKFYWRYGFFQWVADNTLRLIAKRGREWIDNLLILESWAKQACRNVYRVA